jgi:hypothetical protein
MIFMCYGMQKSASSFAWQIVKDLAEIVGDKQLALRLHYIEDIDRRIGFQNIFNIEQFDYFNDRIPQNKIMVIKSHSPLSKKLADHISAKGGGAIATYRDPLDIAVSLLDVGVAERIKPIDKQRPGFSGVVTLKDAVNRLPESIETAESWLANDFIEHILYEKLCYETRIAVNQIMKVFLNAGVDITNDQIENVLSKYSGSSNAIIPEFNVGGVGRYKAVMTQEEILSLKEKYVNFRLKLGFSE